MSTEDETEVLGTPRPSEADVFRAKLVRIRNELIRMHRELASMEDSSRRARECDVGKIAREDLSEAALRVKAALHHVKEAEKRMDYMRELWAPR